MIVVFLDHCQAGIVPIIWRFQSGDASKGKCQRLLHIGDGSRHHLWLILRRAVVGGDEMIPVDGEHCNHHRTFLGSKLLNQCAAVCRQRINQSDFDAFLFAAPLAFERRQAIKRFLALCLVLLERS
jgi:hypothetical protein